MRPVVLEALILLIMRGLGETRFVGMLVGPWQKRTVTVRKANDLLGSNSEMLRVETWKRDSRFISPRARLDSKTPANLFVSCSL
jgi:hypothetical protein